MPTSSQRPTSLQQTVRHFLKDRPTRLRLYTWAGGCLLALLATLSPSSAPLASLILFCGVGIAVVAAISPIQQK